MPAPPTPSPIDRSFAVTVTPTLIWNGPNNIMASLVYTQTGSNPHMPPVVNPGTGAINLVSMPNNNNFTNKMLITFTLDTSNLRDQNGNLLPPGSGRWAYDNEYTGGCWFCAVYQLGGPVSTAPITVPNMRAGRTDQTPGSTVYVYYDPTNTPRGTPIALQYCLGLVLPPFNNYYITIDPTISGTGTKTQPKPHPK
jgi:hypothetical protein